MKILLSIFSFGLCLASFSSGAEQYVAEIKGLSCAGCVSKIETMAKSIKGVKNCKFEADGKGIIETEVGVTLTKEMLQQALMTKKELKAKGKQHPHYTVAAFGQKKP